MSCVTCDNGICSQKCLENKEMINAKQFEKVRITKRATWRKGQFVDWVNKHVGRERFKERWEVSERTLCRWTKDPSKVPPIYYDFMLKDIELNKTKVGKKNENGTGRK